jgi:hypothetical protein
VKGGQSGSSITFTSGLQLVDELLRDDARSRMLDTVVDPGNVDASLERLRKAMRSHTFAPASRELRRVVDSLDGRTRREGFHVLQGWDFVAQRFAKDIAPVLLIDYCARQGIAPQRLRESTAVLLDQYFLALLSLFAMRAWDDGDASENLDRITGALGHLQGKQGSGHEFVSDAETLLMVAVSYFHPEEQGYELLVDRVAALDAAHRASFAIPCATLMGFHLRWGLRFMYARDIGRMRDDNAADYPLLVLALETLAREYASASRAQARHVAVVQGLLNGLSSDPWAFVEAPPRVLHGREDWHSTVRGMLHERRDALLDDFGAHQPTPRTYSPLSFTCNFPTNATVALAALAVQGEAHPVINSLFTDLGGAGAHRLAQRLMEFATSDESRLGAGGAPLLAYDPYEGAHAYNTTLRTLHESANRGSSRS